MAPSTLSLKERRIRLHMTGAEFARMAKVSLRTLKRAEAGQQISDVNQQKIAEALGVEDRRELFAEAVA